MEVENVFNVDINKLSKLIHKNVKIKLKHGLPELKGRVYTIDPVSQNIVLLKKVNGAISVEIAFHHAVEEISMLEKIPDELSENEIANLFSNQLHIAQPSLEKKYFLDWLNDSKIPFTQIDDKVDIEGVVVHPPYTSDSCESSNLIKLSRIQSLLNSIPTIDDKNK